MKLDVDLFGYHDSFHIPFTGSFGEGGGPHGPPPTGGESPYPPAPDYSDAMIVESKNSTMVANAQILSQEFAMQQASMDRDLQRTADLEKNLETLDTKLELGKMDFLLAMTSNENLHTEKLAQLAAQNKLLENGGQAQTQASFDIPAPEGF